MPWIHVECKLGPLVCRSRIYHDEADWQARSEEERANILTQAWGDLIAKHIRITVRVEDAPKEEGV